MKIGILGLDWDIGIPLALALRDYGRHAIIAYGDPQEIDKMILAGQREASREARTLLDEWAIPVTDRMQLFVEYCELVYVCEPDLVGMPLGWVDRYRSNLTRLPLVVACPLQIPLVLKAWARSYHRLDFGYQPCYTTRADGINRLTNPGGAIWVAGSETVHAVVERAWRPVINTVAVKRAPLGHQILPAGVPEGTVVGSPLATERLEGLLGHVDNPPPVERQGEGP